VDGTGLYVAGLEAVPGGGAWRIEARDRSTGALVAGFGTAGVVTSDPSAGSGGYRETVTALAADGTSLYLAGVDDGSGNAGWRVERRQR
jgi:hypothetical protein